MMDELDRQLQKDCSQAAAYTDKEGKDDHHIPFRQFAQKTSERGQYVLYDKSAAHDFTDKSCKYNQFKT